MHLIRILTVLMRKISYFHFRIVSIRHTAFLPIVFFAVVLLISSCTHSNSPISQNTQSAPTGSCERKTIDEWASYGIGEIANVDCLDQAEIYDEEDASTGDYQLSPTVVYFSGKWNHKRANACYTGAAMILSQCGIHVPMGKIIGVRSNLYEDIDARSKVAILRSRIDDQNFSRFPIFLVASSYMENWMNSHGDEKVVNGFVTQGGDESNNAVIINASVRYHRKKCGIVMAHEWVHFIRDWPNNRYPGHDISGHHPSKDNLLYKSLAADSLTQQQCQQIIENGVQRGIINKSSD